MNTDANDVIDAAQRLLLDPKHVSKANITFCPVHGQGKSSEAAVEEDNKDDSSREGSFFADAYHGGYQFLRGRWG